MINHYLISNLNLTIYACYVLHFINIILFFSGFSRNGKAYKIFAINLFVILLGEMISEIMIKNRYENISMSHYYFILQFIFLSFFYLEILTVPFQKKIVKITLIMIPLILTIQYILNPRLIFVFNLFEVFVCSFSIIIYATFHFYNMLSEKRSFYYLNSGILIYLFGSSIIFLCGNVLIMKHNGIIFYLPNLNLILYFFYLSMITYEWFKNYSKIK